MTTNRLVLVVFAVVILGGLALMGVVNLYDRADSLAREDRAYTVEWVCRSGTQVDRDARGLFVWLGIHRQRVSTNDPHEVCE